MVYSATAPNLTEKLGNYLKSPWSVILIILAMVAIFHSSNLQNVIIFALKALLSTSPYIAFAILMLAFLKATGAETMVAHAFQGREIRMIFFAAFFGGLAPFCSCEVIPFIAGLLALGAPLSAVMAFWLASPLIDPPTLLITASALGWPFAIAKAIAAVTLGIFGGFVVKILTLNGFLSKSLKAFNRSGCCSSELTSERKPVWCFWKRQERRYHFRDELIHNGLFLLKWLSLAYVLEALLVSYVSAEFIAGMVGGEGVVPIATAAIVGMPAYLNSYVAPPLLAGLITQGMSFGAAMSFMVAGSVSSIPAMAAVWSLVKPKVFMTYLGLGLSGAIVTGIIFEILI
ncbi:MAG: permease [Aestuariivita sp.]|nr:permease [Aestuariivita sp.]